MLNEDIPIGSIAKMMGHADITSTQVYAQVTEQKISNDMDKLIAKRERNRLSNEKTIHIVILCITASTMRANSYQTGMITGVMSR